MKAVRFTSLVLFSVYIGFFSEPVQADLSVNTGVHRLVDFQLSYPFISFNESVFEPDRRGSVGVGLNYHVFFWRHFGFTITPSAWFASIRVEKKKFMVYCISLAGGPTLRPFPSSYFDPMVSFSSGIAGSDAGSLAKARFVYPLKGTFAVNLFRQTEMYRDNELALTLSLSSAYVAQALSMLEPWMYEVAVAFRGSF